MVEFDLAELKIAMTTKHSLTVLYQGELYGSYPHLEVTGSPQMSHWGPVPRWAALALQGTGPFAAWRAVIPDDLVLLALRYEKIYQWGILQLCGLLSEGDPRAVKVFVARCTRMPPYPLWLVWLRTMKLYRRDQLRGHAKTILRETCALPRSVLRRISFSAVCWNTLEGLNRKWPELENRTQRALRGMTNITMDTVRCVVDLPAPCVTPQLLKATARSQLFEIFESVRLALHFSGGEWRWGNVDDYETLLALPHRLSAHVHGEVFDPPPLAGTTGIEPISSEKELLIEAKVMQHCLFRFCDEIVCGQLYAYRVEIPSRATVTIRLTDEGHWKLCDVTAQQNRAVPDDTRHYVEQWIVEAGGVL